MTPVKIKATWLLALLLALAPLAASAAGDRIFANGFDPCCRIGGTVSGLSGAGMMLRLDAGTIHESHAISHNGLYDFVASVPLGTSFALTISGQPSGQTCTLAFSDGTIGSSDVTNADVACSVKLKWNAGLWGQDWY